MFFHGTRRATWITFVGGIVVLAIASIIGRYLWLTRNSPLPSVSEIASVDLTQDVSGGAVQLSAEEQQKIGLQTAEVVRETLTDEIAAIGHVTETESALSTVSSRYGGRIDRLFLNFTGQPVQKGDLVASITVTGSDQAQGINSPISGILRARKVTEGRFVSPGDPLVELTDLGTVWVMADVFDRDIARIRPGQSAHVTSEALPATRLSGEVTFIVPYSDPQSRTTPVRIRMENPGARLKPGMIVQASFPVTMGNVLTVPQTAVIDSGLYKVVYVAGDNGVFERRNIDVGVPVQGRYPVLGGLKSGEKVVTNGAFLIDSQSRLTGGLTGMFGGSKSYAEGAASASPASSAFKMTVKFDPDPPQGTKQNTIHVVLVDASGKPVRDAQVRLTFTMPAMPAMNMPEMRNGTELKWTGSDYTGQIQIMMAGGWNVGIEARRGNELIATSQTHINAR